MLTVSTTTKRKREIMKTITVKITAPKCGATSDQLKEALAQVLGANVEYVGARLSVMPPDVKTIVNGAVKSITKTLKENTLPWIGNERVVADEKVDLIIDELNGSAEKAKKIIEEQAGAMKVWLPQVRTALGKGVDMVELPDPNDFKLDVVIGQSEPSKAGKGLPRDANQAEAAAALAKGSGYENLIDHLLALADKVGPGKDGSAAALRLKNDTATAVKLGAVDKAMIDKINLLTGKLLLAGKSGAKKAAAKAGLVTAITDASNVGEEGELKGAVEDAEVVVEKAEETTEEAPVKRSHKKIVPEDAVVVKEAKAKPVKTKDAKKETSHDKAVSLI